MTGLGRRMLMLVYPSRNSYFKHSDRGDAETRNLKRLNMSISWCMNTASRPPTSDTILVWRFFCFVFEKAALSSALPSLPRYST
ncbi:unnamed protein product [Fusarium graminearum]|nr:unnamed protein product [Fusarium graminearum]VTO93246.1 unnamed protein product [Fusarium graminearum]